MLKIFEIAFLVTLFYIRKSSSPHMAVVRVFAKIFCRLQPEEDVEFPGLKVRLRVGGERGTCFTFYRIRSRYVSIFIAMFGL